jgi:hypothetical protein
MNLHRRKTKVSGPFFKLNRAASEDEIKRSTCGFPVQLRDDAACHSSDRKNHERHAGF